MDYLPRPPFQYAVYLAGFQRQAVNEQIHGCTDGATDGGTSAGKEGTDFINGPGRELRAVAAGP